MLDISSPTKDELSVKSSPEDLIVPPGSFTDDSLELEDDINDVATRVSLDGYNNSCQPVTVTQTQNPQTAVGQLKETKPHPEEPRVSELQTEAQREKRQLPARQAPVSLLSTSSHHVAMKPAPHLDTSSAQHVPPVDRLAFPVSMSDCADLPASATDLEGRDQTTVAVLAMPHSHPIAGESEAVSTTVLPPGAQDQMQRVTVSGDTLQRVLSAVDVEMPCSGDVQIEDQLAAGTR